MFSFTAFFEVIAMLRSFQYGGQAVIEGVMMRGPTDVAVAVRGPNGDIIVEREKLNPVQERYPILKKPVLRGFVALIDSMVLGIRMLTHSANLAMDEEEEELSLGELVLSITLAVGLAVVLFIVVPTVAAHFMSGIMGSFGQNIVEGILRIVMFLGYVVVISVFKDIQRVFQYHGAEHKVIHAYEAGVDLDSTEGIQTFSTLHPRCGTAFLLIVIVLTIFFFAFLGSPPLFERVVSRIILLPLIAGVAYEFLKFSAKHQDNFFIRGLIAPGLWLQKLTTREPDDGQIEVAVKALRAVLEQEQEKEEQLVP
jgi:uncharacterized protein YqhQ